MACKLLGDGDRYAGADEPGDVAVPERVEVGVFTRGVPIRNIRCGEIWLQ